MAAVEEFTRDMSPRARAELLRWLEGIFQNRYGRGGGSGIRFNSENNEIPLRWLHVSTTDVDDDGNGMLFEDYSGSLNGIKHIAYDGLVSTKTGYTEATPDEVTLGMTSSAPGGGSLFKIDRATKKVYAFLDSTGWVYEIRDSSNAAVFKVTESTGLTTATLDGGSP